MPLLAGAILCGSAASPAPLLVGRFLCGLGLGVASGVVPVYLSEISPISSRGAWRARRLTPSALTRRRLFFARRPRQCQPAVHLRGHLGRHSGGNPAGQRPEAVALECAVLLTLQSTSLTLNFFLLAHRCSVFYAASVPAAVMLIAGGAIRESPSWSPKPSQSAVSAGSSAEPSGGWGELLLPAHRKATLLAVGLFVIQQCAWGQGWCLGLGLGFRIGDLGLGFSYGTHQLSHPPPPRQLRASTRSSSSRWPSSRRRGWRRGWRHRRSWRV